MRRITPKQKQRWEMYHRGGYSCRQIAEVDNISRQAVEKSLKQVAKRFLVNGITKREQ